jgi:hypothetical protein
MTYQATWTNDAGGGRLTGGLSRVRLLDAQELADAINRRRHLTYQSAQSFSSALQSGEDLRRSLLSTAVAPPFDNFHLAMLEKVLDPPTGIISGVPPSPSSMTWLWPGGDGDENKPLVSGLSGVPQGCVGLIQKVSGASQWTDGSLVPGQTYSRAMHVNELRAAAEWLRRGRWEMPIYFCAGLFSILPDSSWLAEFVANNGEDELRNVGFAFLNLEGTPPAGLFNVAVRSSSHVEVTADEDCTVELHHCLRRIDRVNLLSSWNEYDQTNSGAWTTPGGVGPGDSELMGSVGLSAGVPNTIAGDGVRNAFGAMIDGAAQNFLIRRADTGWLTVGVSARAVVEFDLNSPPN